MQKIYNAKEVERKWQDIWRKKNVYEFKINSEGKKTYSIDTPPPFTSGTLHLGHIYNHVWIDIVARYKRMRNFNVYLPQGFDCHGLPTELKVEKEMNISRKERKKFLEKCELWTNEAISKMKKQFDMIGYSTDWAYSYRTMDSEYKAFVQKTLLIFFRKGLLYREKHPVLWCPKCETALAKAEVGYVEREGKLYYIDIDVRDGDKITIATTRPELMSSCVAIFVHPQDKRYKKFVGKKAILPIFKREVPIMEDHEVDMNFGTGAVYLCTFGDEQDIAWQKKYSLPVIISINSDGTLNENAGKYKNLKVEKAREEIVKDLSSLGKIQKIEKFKHNVLSHTERESCKCGIELLPFDQWFIKVREFRNEIVKKAKEMNWYPEHMMQRLIDWSDSLDWDWCISRQRVFGTPIPFWICDNCGEVIPANENELPIDPRDTIRKCPKCGGNAKGEEDVCDCWIDSSVTPLIISKFGKDDEFFNKTYPSSLRPQGYEIIRTWAFYTIFRNLIITNKACFKDLLINGMVAGPDGKKMSKSLGNVITPEEVLEKYSVDALRQWASLGSLGDDYPFSWEECEHSQAFLNKLWNIARFVKMHTDDYNSNEEENLNLREIDKGILSKLQKLKEECTKNLDNYIFNIPLERIRSFVWHDFADNYIEMVKHRLYKPEIYGKNSRRSAQYTLKKILLDILKLLTPFTPHICEEIWENFSGKEEKKEYIVNEKWPKIEKNLINNEAEEIEKLGEEIISEIRKYKSINSIPLNKELKKVVIKINEDKLNKEKIKKIEEDIKGTGKIKELIIEPLRTLEKNKKSTEKEPLFTLNFFQ